MKVFTDILIRWFLECESPKLCSKTKVLDKRCIFDSTVFNSIQKFIHKPVSKIRKYIQVLRCNNDT